MVKLPFVRKNSWPRRKGRSENLFEIGKDNQLFVEKIKVLRAILEQKLDLHCLKVIGVTSSIPGEGKTLSCAHLGFSLASTGRKRVLLVDIDIRKGDLTHGMGERRSPGLTDYLQGGASFAQILRTTSVPNLFLVTTGAEVASPADLLAGEKFKVFLKEIRTQYDSILLDTPPILPVADTPTIRDLTDGFLLLYRAGVTPHPMFRQAVDDLGEKNILGTVLNGVERPRESYLKKYYGDYYYQRQGNKSSEKENDVKVQLRSARKG